MASVLALVADLMFGSRVQSALTASGHDVRLVGDECRLREQLGGATDRTDGGVAAAGAVAAPDVLVVDLTDGELAGERTVASLRAEGALAHTRTLGFYAHVDPDARERALAAGFDLVVPRSRMAREGVALVDGLLVKR